MCNSTWYCKHLFNSQKCLLKIFPDISLFVFLLFGLKNSYYIKIRICLTRFGKRKGKNEDQSIRNKSGLYHDNCGFFQQFIVLWYSIFHPDCECKFRKIVHTEYRIHGYIHYSNGQKKKHYTCNRYKRKGHHFFPDTSSGALGSLGEICFLKLLTNCLNSHLQKNYNQFVLQLTEIKYPAERIPEKTTLPVNLSSTIKGVTQLYCLSRNSIFT